MMPPEGEDNNLTSFLESLAKMLKVGSIEIKPTDDLQ
jgi:hypothetical protein